MKMQLRDKIILGIKITLGITCFVIAFGFGTMHLWNWLVPDLFKGPVITFWQAIGLLILSKILFSGMGGGKFAHRRHEWKRRMHEKFSHMTPEEKEAFRARLKDRCRSRWSYRDDFEESFRQPTDNQTT